MLAMFLQVLSFGDCAVNVTPTSEELAKIAVCCTALSYLEKNPGGLNV